MLGVTMVTFNSSKVGIVHKYSNHGTLIELIWTITPAFVLIAIAFPSFKLLYLLDVYTLTLSTLWLVLRAQPVSIASITTTCTALVPYGSMGIRFNRGCLSQFTLTATLRSYIVGHLLGDGSLHMTWSSKNPYFTFTHVPTESGQLKRFWYAWDVLQQFACMCQKSLTMYGSHHKGSYNTNVTLHSRSMPCLWPLFDLFHPCSQR